MIIWNTLCIFNHCYNINILSGVLYNWNSLITINSLWRYELKNVSMEMPWQWLLWIEYIRVSYMLNWRCFICYFLSHFYNTNVIWLAQTAQDGKYTKMSCYNRVWSCICWYCCLTKASEASPLGHCEPVSSAFVRQQYQQTQDQTLKQSLGRLMTC